MKNVIFLIPIFLLSFGCSNSDYSNSDVNKTFPVQINFTLISKGGLQVTSQDVITEENLVVTTSQEWQQLRNQMDLENIYSHPYTETDIDFSQYMVLAAFDEIQPHSGYWISISNITEQPDSVFVEVTTGNGSEGYDVMNRPFHIVKIPITNKPIVFQ